jgi:hypothetical protein
MCLPQNMEHVGELAEQNIWLVSCLLIGALIASTVVVRVVLLAMVQSFGCCRSSNQGSN